MSKVVIKEKKNSLETAATFSSPTNVLLIFLEHHEDMYITSVALVHTLFTGAGAGGL